MKQKMKESLLKIKQIKMDKKFYPRMKWNFHTAFNYANAMNAGSEFPPVEVAKIKNKYYLVDGRHRIEANKMNGEKYVQCIVNTEIKKLDELYLEAVKRNAKHGRPFSVQERANIALTLKKMEFSDIDISKIIAVPIEKFEKFMADRVTNTVSGETIPLKSSMKQFASTTVEDTFPAIQDTLQGIPQARLLDEFIHLLENGLLDTSNKDILKRVNKIINLVFELDKTLQREK